MDNKFIKVKVLYRADSFTNFFEINGEHLKVQDLYDITAEKYNVIDKELIASQKHLFRLKPFTIYLNTDSIAYFRIDYAKRSCHQREEEYGPMYMEIAVIVMKDGNVFVADNDDFAKEMNLE